MVLLRHCRCAHTWCNSSHVAAAQCLASKGERLAACLWGVVAVQSCPMGSVVGYRSSSCCQSACISQQACIGTQVADRLLLNEHTGHTLLL
jgi:hypothetical protein